MTTNKKTNSVQLMKNPKDVINAWVLETVSNLDMLWEVEITKANTPFGFNVSTEYLTSKTGCTAKSAFKYRVLAYPIIEKMIEENILVTLDKGKNVAAINFRRILLNWYRKLSMDNKNELPILGNKISFGKMIRGTSPITRKALNYPLVKETMDYIHNDLTDLSIISSNYESVAERNKKKQNNPQKVIENRKKYFSRLANNSLIKIEDFIISTDLEPFVQVQQLFACQIKTLSNESSVDNYINACNYFIKFLTLTYGNIPFSITEHFDEHTLSRFRNFLEQQIITRTISNSHANNMLCSVRNTLNRMTMIKGISYKFFDVDGFDTSRQTDLKKPFSNNERLQICNAIEKGLSESKACFEPYQKTGVGINPLDENGNIKRCHATIENARWLFENRLNCQPVYYHNAKTNFEKKFLRIVQISSNSLEGVYKKWGVTSILTVDIFLPYILKLAKVTGLNLDSLLNLEIDDYVDYHPATLKPCLRYWKERSTGHKEYHLDLIKADLKWLTSGQAKTVKCIFEEVLELTKEIRLNARDTDTQNKLFIYQSNSRKLYGKSIAIKGKNRCYSSALSLSIRKFIEKHSLKDDKGIPLTLTISRFRPTLVSELVENGVSLREIQLMLGHSSIRTTIGYLDSHDFNSISRTQLNHKITELHDSIIIKDIHQHQNSIQVNSDSNDEVKVFFRTPFAECKNIFNPPDFVKNLSSYIPGNPCAQYNKCLSCDNVVITVQDLPRLFAMERDYKHLIEHSQISDTPYAHVVFENLQLINSIVDPNISDFSSKELERAKQLAEYVEISSLIETVVL